MQNIVNLPMNVKNHKKSVGLKKRNETRLVTLIIRCERERK